MTVQELIHALTIQAVQRNHIKSTIRLEVGGDGAIHDASQFEIGYDELRNQVVLTSESGWYS